jgi:CelD/BcsL family acetyltransferase involved in cellulose biosynthesis
LKAELVPVGELTRRQLDYWYALAERAIEPNPFFDPDFVLPAARGLGETGDVAIACVHDGDEWLGCLPVRRYQRWHRLPLPCVATWRHSYCLLGTPLLAPGRPGEALAAIVEAMHTNAGPVAFAALEWIPTEGAVGAALADLPGRPIPFEQFSRAALRRRPQCDYLEGQVKGKHRREFRRMARALEEELEGELTLVDRTGDPAAVEAFLSLEASGWKGREETALAAHQGHAAFFTEMSGALASRRSFELLFLEANGETAAARCSLIAGEMSFCFKVAYNERFSRYSPGRELELRLIERFHEENLLTSMDSCADTGNELYNRIWPDRRELATVAYRSPGPLGLVARPGLRGVVLARERKRQ